MEENKAKAVGMDVAGFAAITDAVRDLLNSFPGRKEQIRFEELGESAGVAFSADSGALIMTERRSITDHVSQTCQYPFFVICRTASTRELQKLNVLVFLENLGKWLCRENVEIDGTIYKLKAYPKLTDNRTITKITRSNVYGLAPNENGSQDWMLPVVIDYTNEFDMW